MGLASWAMSSSPDQTIEVAPSRNKSLVFESSEDSVINSLPSSSTEMSASVESSSQYSSSSANSETSSSKDMASVMTSSFSDDATPLITSVPSSSKDFLPVINLSSIINSMSSLNCSLEFSSEAMSPKTGSSNPTEQSSKMCSKMSSPQSKTPSPTSKPPSPTSNTVSSPTSKPSSPTSNTSLSPTSNPSSPSSKTPSSPSKTPSLPETMMTLDDLFLEACKEGDTEFVKNNINAVDVNYSQGWNLRRAIRYNQASVWRQLLHHSSTLVNLPNKRGLSALHTACRFNIGDAVEDLLKHPAILVNESTAQGSTPVMVAAKYCSKLAMEALLKDYRVDLHRKDEKGREVEDMVGVARDVSEEEKEDVVGQLKREKQIRRGTRGASTGSIEEEIEEIDTRLRQQVIDKIKAFTHKIEEEDSKLEKEEAIIETRWNHPMAELDDIHNKEVVRMKAKQEADSMELADNQKTEMIVFIENQEKELRKLIEGQQRSMQMFRENHEAERAEFKQRQRNDLSRMRERQNQETMTVVRAREAERTSILANSSLMKTGLKKAVSHLCTELNLLEHASPGSRDLVEAARQDLTCVVCQHLMAPPVRIWQCEAGHLLCETCRDWLGQTVCPSCRVANITGRNLALERIARSLFDEK